MRMQGKVCVVTGAASSQGIGRATADMLAANGAHVVVIDVSDTVDQAAGELAAAHRSSSILGVKCNIVDGAACAEAATKVSHAFSQVDALVHCAGVIRSGRHDQIGEKDFDEVIAVNLAGTFNIIRSFTPAMIARRAGSIVSIASVAAQRGGGLVA